MSNQAILNHVIAYFAWRFKRPSTDFTRATEVRKAWKSDKAWKDLADTFNDMTWMRQMKVKISQVEMGGVRTIGEIAALIEGKAGTKIARLSGAEFGRTMDWARVNA